MYMPPNLNILSISLFCRKETIYNNLEEEKEEETIMIIKPNSEEDRYDPIDDDGAAATAAATNPLAAAAERARCRRTHTGLPGVRLEGRKGKYS